MKWGYEPALRQGGEVDNKGEGSNPAIKSLPTDPGHVALLEYWSAHPQDWARLSEPLRRAVVQEIFGDLPPFDPILEGLHAAETSPGS